MSQEPKSLMTNEAGPGWVSQLGISMPDPVKAQIEALVDVGNIDGAIQIVIDELLKAFS